MSGEKERSRGPRGFWLVVLLLAAEAGMRIVFFFASQSMDLVDNDVPQVVLDFSLAMFLILGIAGLVLLYPLIKGTRIGFHGTVAVCIATIVFDIWGVFAIQSSAAMGMVVPAVAIVYLWVFRDKWLSARADASQ